MVRPRQRSWSSARPPRHGPRMMLTETIAEQTPGDNPPRMHSDHPFALERLGRTADLDPARLPRREDVVDHQSRQTRTRHIAKLLRPGHVVATDVDRSEEHTSELQSRFDLVCRLLLEKKKHNGQKHQLPTRNNLYEVQNEVTFCYLLWQIAFFLQF